MERIETYAVAIGAANQMATALEGLLRSVKSEEISETLWVDITLAEAALQGYKAVHEQIKKSREEATEHA